MSTKQSNLFQIISKQDDYDLFLLSIIIMCVVLEMQNLSAISGDVLKIIQEDADFGRDFCGIFIGCNGALDGLAI